MNTFTKQEPKLITINFSPKQIALFNPSARSWPPFHQISQGSKNMVHCSVDMAGGLQIWPHPRQRVTWDRKIPWWHLIGCQRPSPQRCVNLGPGLCYGTNLGHKTIFQAPNPGHSMSFRADKAPLCQDPLLQRVHCTTNKQHKAQLFCSPCFEGQQNKCYFRGHIYWMHCWRACNK